MDFILEGFRQAFFLILSLDQEVLGIAFLSLWISTAAILLASVIGVPLGFVIGTTQLPGKHLTITFFNTLISAALYYPFKYLLKKATHRLQPSFAASAR